uniref:Actin-related protein 6 (Trinotate prediction) n=1 Tax=Myxobolus squamalis TaxID=59785 RepID=A0A6B2G492_MYXSQ
MKRLRLKIIRKKTHGDWSRTKMALIVDHGGYTVKIEHSTSQDPQLVQNCFCKSKSDHRSVYIGNQFNSLIDKASLYINHPIQKGFIVNWEYQKELWDYLFNSNEFEVLSSTKYFLF